MSVINRERDLPIGWGIATRTESRGYYLIETRATRSSARNRVRDLNNESENRRYRVVRLSASHP